jgi:hypothetical protein
MNKLSSTRQPMDNLLSPLIPIQDDPIPDLYKPDQVPEDFKMRMINNNGKSVISYSSCHIYSDRIFLGPVKVLYHDANNWIEPIPIPDELYPWIQNFEVIAMPRDKNDNGLPKGCYGPLTPINNTSFQHLTKWSHDPIWSHYPFSVFCPVSIDDESLNISYWEPDKDMYLMIGGIAPGRSYPDFRKNQLSNNWVDSYLRSK